MVSISYSHCSSKACSCSENFRINIYILETINPLPDDKIVGLPKLKAFAVNKSNVTQNIVFHRIENTVAKEDNAGYQMTTQEAFVDSVDQDQTAQNV